MTRWLPQVRSLQSRLLFSVMGLSVLVWLVTILATWSDTEHEVGELLDAHLSQAASLLVTLPLEELSRLRLQESPNLHEYQPKVVFQAWHLDELVAKSVTAPRMPLGNRQTVGFSTGEIEGEHWRVFAAKGNDPHVMILVGEKDVARTDVIYASLRSVIWPVSLALPLMALGVWLAVRHAVKPLKELGQTVAHRRADDDSPLPDGNVPSEAKPLVQELNRLFERSARLLASERRFTADAAHELRTPIAAIRIQTQVAQGAQDDVEREDAFRQTLLGCDRAAHLVDQLLQLARLEANGGTTEPATSDLRASLERVQQELKATHPNTDRRLRVEVDAPISTQLASPMPQGLTHAVLRNLLDNALRYSGPTGQVQLKVHSCPQQERLCLTVEDSGPGLTEAQLAQLGERFFRVLGSGQSGSGLGWSIVRRVATLHHITVDTDRSPRMGGLRVRLEWNHHRA